VAKMKKIVREGLKLSNLERVFNITLLNHCEYASFVNSSLTGMDQPVKNICSCLVIFGLLFRLLQLLTEFTDLLDVLFESHFMGYPISGLIEDLSLCSPSLGTDF